MIKQLVFLIICVVIPVLGDAAVLHTVIVADTHARMVGTDIGMSVRNDFRSVRNDTHAIALKTGMEVSEHLCIDEGGSARHVIQAVRQLEAKPDDVIIFYFAGHGIRTEKGIDDPWPTLNFGIDQKRIAFSSIIKLLEAKNARLLVALCDVCNNMIPEEYALPEILITRGRVGQRPQLAPSDSALHRLFLQTKGVVLACAAKPDTVSYTGPKNGGLFTHYFFQSLHAEVATAQDPSWKTILIRTSQLISDLQEPFYVVRENRHVDILESKN